MALALFATNIRLMIENLRKYGILVTLSGATVRQSDWTWAGALFVLTPCHLFVALWIEQQAAQIARRVAGQTKRAHDDDDLDAIRRRGRTAVSSAWISVAVCHGVNATWMLVFATWAVYNRIHNPGLGAFTEIHAVVVWLKVCSYALTNRDLRIAMLSGEDEILQTALSPLYRPCPYPNNITFHNLCYFWWAPTLVYQPVYPRSGRRRWDFIFKRIAEFFLLSALIWVTIAQYAVPLLHNSLADISTLNYINILERTLKLSTISLVCWLAGFFALFQSFLNGLAELLRFGDREFYSDWWNSGGLREYWASWNKPVMNFMRRHIYNPMVARGVKKTTAQIVTFIFSGLLHELLVGVPTHNILGVAFAGMLLQLPLIFLTDPFSRRDGQNWKLVGNCVFWVTFCLFGQPIAAMAYFFAWHAKYAVGPARPEWPVAMPWSNRTL